MERTRASIVMRLAGICQDCHQTTQIYFASNEAREEIQKDLQRGSDPQMYLQSQHFGPDDDKNYCRGSREHPRRVYYLDECSSAPPPAKLG